MTRPIGYLWRMLGFLGLVAAVAVPLVPSLAGAFMANPWLNGLILAVLLGGVGWNIRQVLLLRAEVAWLDAFRNARQGAPAQPAPRLLAPLASMLGTRRSDRLNLSAAALRSVLDGIVSRLDETRELSRYMTGLLIFLGLLGTFWGLLLTIGAIAGVVGSMRLEGGDPNTLFETLQAGLAAPLSGMGVAFSSSLFGLAGALVLGFLDLTAGQAQNRFATELEDWLAGQTLLSGEAAPHIPEQAAEQLEALHALLARGEEGRQATDAALMRLTDRLSVLSEQMRATQALLARLAAQAEAPPREGRDG